jgi:hypothetical protein
MAVSIRTPSGRNVYRVFRIVAGQGILWNQVTVVADRSRKPFFG